MIYLIDGGFSTQLEVYTGQVENNPLWSSKYLYTNPQSIIRTHCDFIAAGSDIITTNTYQASIDGFKEHLQLEDKTSKQLIAKAVDYAREAIVQSNSGREVLIAGSIGPYGAHLVNGSEYTGSYMDEVTEAELIAWHRPKMEILVDKKVDLLAIETIPALGEALAILKLLKEFPEQKAWISFSVKDREHTSYGDKFVEAAAECWKLSSNQLVAVGTNCLHPAFVTPLLTAAQHLDIPWIVYPNSGEKWQPGIGWTDKETCVPLASFVPEWLSLGVKFVGGCCQVTADQIKPLRQLLDRLPSSV